MLMLPHAFRAQEGRYAAAIREGREALTQLVAKGQAPGLGVAVAVGGEVVWSEGFGLANLEHRVPVSVQTRFGLGSISKTLTMAAAMRLVDKGTLDLDAPIEKYLPDFPHRGQGITVRRLAAHQSGLSDAFAASHYLTTRDFPTLDPAYREITRHGIDYPPGSKTVYATGLFTIIGRVLEAAGGLDYRVLMAREVFEPVGIGPSVNDARTIIEHRSGYYANGEAGRFEHAPVVNPTHKLPGAGFIATPSEVARFGAALLRPSFLSERARREMFTPVPLADGTPTEWGLGLQVGTDQHGRVLHLPGGGLGISGWLFIHPDANVVIALLSNVNTAPVGGRAYRRIADAFLAAAR
jgi:CubicO group peptidase (beta-lactamase class C family)